MFLGNLSDLHEAVRVSHSCTQIAPHTSVMTVDAVFGVCICRGVVSLSGLFVRLHFLIDANILLYTASLLGASREWG